MPKPPKDQSWYDARFPKGATKICFGCKATLPVMSFGEAKGNRDGLHIKCRRCRRIQQIESHKRLAKNPLWREKRRRWNHQKSLRKCGATLEDYDRLYAAQGGKCFLCGCTTKRTLAVDHDHQTGTIRRLLCGNCNRGIGYLKDDPKLLRKAAEYVEGFRSVTDKATE